MNFAQFLRKTIRYFWSLHLTAAFGAAVTAAVLTGALVVGDSMRFSLRRLTLDRLGRVDQALTGPYWLTNASAERWSASPEFTAAFDAVVPLIRLYAALQVQSPDGAAAGHVQVLGCDHRFWSAFDGAPPRWPGPREIVLNRRTAELLGAAPGDRLILRLPRPEVVPGESVFGRKADTIESTVVTVTDVIADEGAGRFALEPSQQVPRNAFVDLQWLAERLDRPGAADVWLITGKRPDRPADTAAERRLGESAILSADDLDLRLEETARGYLHLTSRRMLLAPSLRRLVESRLGAATVDPVFFYLLESVRAGTHSISYATAAAMELAVAPPLGPFPASDGKPVATPREDEVVLNTWAAEQLQVSVGDTVEVTWFEPEQTGGEVGRHTQEFRVSGITAIAEGADDPELMPEVAGLTDRRSIADWDPPFPFDARRVTPADEEYWQRHRGTPKAYFSPRIAARFWANRWGDATSLRVLSPNVSPDELRSRLRFSPREAGITLLPVKRQGMAASAGTTSFSMLFLGFNMFVMVAGLLLTSLLFRLGIEKQARQLGVLSAVGWPPRRLLEFLLGQACAVSLLGGILGVPLGLGYAAAFVAGLNTIWLPAVVVPFLRFHAETASLLIGGCAGVLTAVVVTTSALVRLVRVPTRSLLAGSAGEAATPAGNRKGAPKLAGWASAICFLSALGAATQGGRGDETQQAVAFFLVGLLSLAGALLAVLAWLHRSAGQALAARSLGGLALRNAARNPTRSTLSLGMTAAACFLIFSVAAFRLDPSQSAPATDGGNGGFHLLGETDQPIFADLNTPTGRQSLGFSAEDARLLDAVRIFPLRLQSGENADCLNLYRPHQPRVLGVPQAFRQRDGFAFAAGRPAQASAAGSGTNPWELLEPRNGASGSPTTPIPAILDDATVKYSLNLSGVGAEFEILDGRGRPVRLKIVATLQNSIFQGNVLIAEEQFVKLFPDTTGYRFFLVEPREPPVGGVSGNGGKTVGDWREEARRVQRVLERQCLDYGMTMTLTTERQTALLAVQNTYLSTFQSLGALGLLLGTFGLAAAQIRGVAERQSELALLRAVGFRNGRIRNLIVLESLVLLGGGLAMGTASAAAAVLPQWLLGRAIPPVATLLWIVPISLAIGLTSAALAGRQLTALPLIGALRRE